MMENQEDDGVLEEFGSHDIQPTGVPMPPRFIKAVPQLRDDLFVLNEFLSAPSPPIVNERNRIVHVVRYGFGDASGTGFGSLLETRKGIKYRVGVWGSDDETESSNYKEFENIVSTIEEAVKAGDLEDAVLFFFTDNSTVESALYKGNSKSRKLFELIVRFRKLQMLSGTHVHVSHVSGKRMGCPEVACEREWPEKSPTCWITYHFI
jgi:hypothetical protein